MRHPLLPAFATLGAVQGWLLLDGYDGAFDCSGPLTVCPRDGIWSVAVFGFAAAAVAALLARTRAPTIARFVAYFFAATYLTVCVPLLLDGGHVRWDADLALGVLVGPFPVALFSLPFFAPAFFAWRSRRARPRSLVGDAEVRALWTAVTVAIVTATSLTSHFRGWIFDDKVGRRGPPTLGARIELGLELFALLAMAPLVARDVGDAVRVSRIDPRSLTLGPRPAMDTLDLGIGAGTSVEVLEAGTSYRRTAVGLAVRGDIARAQRALLGCLWLDAIAVAIGIAALCAFEPRHH